MHERAGRRLTIAHRATPLAVALALTSTACGDSASTTSTGTGGTSSASTGTGSTSTSSTAQTMSSGTMSSGTMSSGTMSSGTGGAGGSLASFTAALEADAMTVAAGKMAPIDLSACCAMGKNCAGNNPASPYLAWSVPPAPGQTAENPNPDPSGMSDTFRLREDEAIVWLGRTPPTVKYFGFTPYLVEHQIGQNRAVVFASLTDTLNNGVIGVDPSSGTPYDAPTVIVATADRGTEMRVRAALVSSGYPAASINTIAFDASQANLGLDATSDTVGLLVRVAIPADKAASDAWVAAPPGDLIRVTPNMQATADPIPTPVARAKNETLDEAALSASVDSLRAAIIAAHPGYTVDDIAIDDGLVDPSQCIANLTDCFGDNRDTIYPKTPISVVFTKPKDFYVAYGVNHAATGKASYSSVAVYGLQHVYGIDSATSAEYTGSGADYLPSDPNAPELYAWTIARDCTGDAHCLAIPAGMCPSGLDAGAAGFIAYRAYLEPTTNTAPDPSKLVIDHLLRFRAP